MRYLKINVIIKELILHQPKSKKVNMFINSKVFIILMMIIFRQNLIAENHLQIDTIKNFKCEFTYTYSFDKAKNFDINKFGLDYNENDESVGPASILLVDSIVYITDVVHNSLKVINLNNGKIINNITFDTSYNQWLRDIIIFKNNIYISTDINLIYRCSKDFKVIDKIVINEQLLFGLQNKYFVIEDKDTLLYFNNLHFYLPFVGNQLVKFESKVHIKDNRETRRKGVAFKINDNTFCFKNKYIILKEKIPDVYEFYDGYNIDFNDTSLVYFSITKNEMKIKYYKW